MYINVNKKLDYMFNGLVQIFDYKVIKIMI